jgi:hypothetical protein
MNDIDDVRNICDDLIVQLSALNKSIEIMKAISIE